MAYSDSLKPLKTHLTILNLVIIGLILFLFIARGNLLGYNSVKGNNSVSAKIIAKKGASIRDMPSRKGKVIVITPINSEIKIIQRKVQSDIIDHKPGSWVKVEYLRKTGYIWEHLID